MPVSPSFTLLSSRSCSSPTSLIPNKTWHSLISCFCPAQALRPLFEKYVLRTTVSSNDDTGGPNSNQNNSCGWSKNTRQREYLELGTMKRHDDDDVEVKKTNVRTGGGRNSSNSSFEDNDSQKHIVRNSAGILVNRDVQITHENIQSEEHVGMSPSRF